MTPRAGYRTVLATNVACVAFVVVTTVVFWSGFYWWLPAFWTFDAIVTGTSVRIALRLRRRVRAEESYMVACAMRFVTEHLRQIGEEPTRILSREEFEDMMNDLESPGWQRDASKWPNPWPWNELPKGGDE